MAAKKLAPVHPGEVLLEEFLGPLGLSQYRLSREINVPPRRINEIVHRKRAITADTALRLARFFSTSERFWLNLQSRYDARTERGQTPFSSRNLLLVEGEIPRCEDRKRTDPFFLPESLARRGRDPSLRSG
jgi:antitoxin HigA-1